MILVSATTPEGEIVLRDRAGTLELIVNGVFAMDSAEVTSELALADAAGSAQTVLVGGLGLGYTATRLLHNGAAHLDIVERAAPILEWASAGVTPQLGALSADHRVRLIHSGIVEFLADSTSHWDAILLDVDNGPSFLIHDDNAAVYARAFLTTCRQRTDCLLIWCETVSPTLQDTLSREFASVELIEIPVTREGRSFSYALYRAS